MTGGDATSSSLQGAHIRSGLTVGDDAALVMRIADREEAALRVAIDTHAKLLHRIAYRMVGDTHEAEDIAQEAMLRLWDHAPRMAANGAAGVRLGAWLKRVTVNLSIDRIRVTKRISGNEVPERADTDPLADEQMVADEQTGTARALIADLPDRQRAAIVLTYYEELPNVEAAGVLDMNIKAFESLLHRARGALRKAYETQQADAGGTA